MPYGRRAVDIVIIIRAECTCSCMTRYDVHGNAIKVMTYGVFCITVYGDCQVSQVLWTSVGRQEYVPVNK